MTPDLYLYRAIVSRVIDGDTIVMHVDLGFNVWFNDQHLRLVGIDTPEIRTRNDLHKKHGLAARQYVMDLLPMGRQVMIRTFRDKSGKYGRWLCDVWLEDYQCWLTEALRQAGFEKRDHYPEPANA